MFSWLWPKKPTPQPAPDQIADGCFVPPPPPVECIIPEAPVAPVEPVLPPKVVAPPLKEDPFYDFRPLFDLFGKSEGTDKGDGYNETLSYGAYTGGDVVLTKLTLDQVDALQTRMLRHPKNKLNSSAVGRYQIVRTTLRKLRKANMIDGGRLYNEAFQDEMCLLLLVGRGLTKYLAGSMKEDQFLTNLSKEWASIPKPDGHGYYDGQRRTPVTPGEVRYVLAEVKRRVGA